MGVLNVFKKGGIGQNIWYMIKGEVRNVLKFFMGGGGLSLCSLPLDIFSFEFRLFP